MAENNRFKLNLTNGIAMIIVVILVGGVGFLANKYKKPIPTSLTPQIAATQSVSYMGVEGKTALDLLKENAEIKTEDSSIGVFVTEINGVPDSQDHYWLYYINGEPAMVGADQYQTNNGDQIEWRYESIM